MADPAVEALAHRARPARRRPPAAPTDADEAVTIRADQIRVEDSREAGPVHVGHQMWRVLTLDAILAAAGLSARARVLTEIYYPPYLSVGERRVVTRGTGRIGSLVGLLRGELSDDVLAVLTDARDGLFPEPRELALDCSCPDGARVCKHVAAVFYGVSVRLDTRPELFFDLRRVDQAELIGSATAGAGRPARGRQVHRRRAAVGGVRDRAGADRARRRRPRDAASGRYAKVSASVTSTSGKASRASVAGPVSRRTSRYPSGPGSRWTSTASAAQSTTQYSGMRASA